MPCKSILIVDDDYNLRATLSIILQREGYDVMVASCAYEAVECLVAGKYDLVFLDIRMPGVDGLTLLNKVHSLYPELPVLVLTAYPSFMAAQEADRSGSWGFFIKPVDPQLLVGCVRELLSDSTAGASIKLQKN